MLQYILYLDLNESRRLFIRKIITRILNLFSRDYNLLARV